MRIGLIEMRTRNLLSDVFLFIECLQTMVGSRVIMQCDDSARGALTFVRLRSPAAAPAVLLHRRRTDCATDRSSDIRESVQEFDRTIYYSIYVHIGDY